MRLLLDTHALVWWLNTPPRLSDRARAAITDAGNEVLVSAVSCYEIELKRPRSVELQRVPMNLEAVLKNERFNWLAVSPHHMTAAGRQPLMHRDPWDRILIAQAKIENALLISADGWVKAYGAPTLW